VRPFGPDARTLPPVFGALAGCRDGWAAESLRGGYCRAVDTIPMPISVGIRFTHATLQVLAEANGIDLLHIKGPAVDDRLLAVLPTDDPPSGAPGTVARSQRRRRRARPPGPRRPAVRGDAPTRMDDRVPLRGRFGLRARRHPDPSGPVPADVHRRFPGIGVDAATAFERLWAERHTVPHRRYAVSGAVVDGSTSRSHRARSTGRRALPLRHPAQLGLRHGGGAGGPAAPRGRARRRGCAGRRHRAPGGVPTARRGTSCGGRSPRGSSRTCGSGWPA
jgi:hypothetical protein